MIYAWNFVLFFFLMLTAWNAFKWQKRYAVLAKDFDTVTAIVRKANDEINAKLAKEKSEIDKIYDQTGIHLHTACMMGKPLYTDNPVFWAKNKYQNHVITNYHALQINKISSNN